MFTEARDGVTRAVTPQRQLARFPAVVFKHISLPLSFNF